MRVKLIWVLLIIPALLKGQTDTLKTDSVKVQVEPIDSAKITDMGVAVAPSSMRFRAKAGKSEIQYLTITNDTYKNNKFKLTFSDFGMNQQGQIMQIPVGKGGEYGLSRWITAAPNFVELAPGERKKVAIEVSLPEEDDAYKAAWCILMVDEAAERKYIVPPKADQNSVSMGVIPTYGFGVYIYQNPPNVKINKVEIVSFNFNYDNENRYVHLRARNIGDGIGFCSSYVEITNLNTGKNDRLPLKRFKVLPGQEREFDFKLPGSIEKGKYSVLGVLDFGSEEELEAAEMEFEVK